MSDFSPITTTELGTHDVEGYPVDVLFKAATLHNVKDLAREIVNTGEGGEARRLVEVLDDNLDEFESAAKTAGVYDEYSQIVFGLQFMYIDFAEDDEIEELFKEYILDALSLGVDVRFYTAKLLGTIRILDDVGTMRGFLMRTMYQNKEELGDRPLVLKGNDRAKPLIQNWLLDYELRFAGEKGPLQEGEYMSSSENVRQLNEKERGYLREILQLFDLLQYPLLQQLPERARVPETTTSVLPEESESTDAAKHRARELLGGSPVKKEANAPVDEKMQEAYNTLPIPSAIIREKLVDLDRRRVERPKMLEQILRDPDQIHDKTYVVAALLLQAPRFKQNNRSAKDTRLFIRALLEQKLGWSEEDSAKLGIRIGKILGKGYDGWAHYNKATKKFEWKQGE